MRTDSDPSPGPSRFITEEMKAGIGRVFASASSYAIDASAVRRWLYATYYPDKPPETMLGERGRPSDPLVPFDFNPFAWDVPPRGLRADGTQDPHWPENQAGIKGPPTTHSINGSLDVEYARRLRVGDVVIETGRIEGYVERSSRTFGQILTTNLLWTWTDVAGRPIAWRRQEFLRYRTDLGSGAA